MYIPVLIAIALNAVLTFFGFPDLQLPVCKSLAMQKSL